MSTGDDMDDAEGETTGINLRSDAHWKIPLRADCIFFVDSADSDEFLLLRFALENAVIMAMDAEWKPVTGRNGKISHPRVAILQIALRLRAKVQVDGIQKSKILEGFVVEDTANGFPGSKSNVVHVEPRSGKRSLLKDRTLSSNGTSRGSCCNGESDENEYFSTQADGILELERDQRSHGVSTNLREENVEMGTDCSTTGKETRNLEEVVFVLDMLALHPSEFSKMLKAAFADPKILKLGFGFKQDLLHLHATFSGLEAHGCFDKVEPYLDIGRIHQNLYADETSFVYRGRRIAGVGCNLSSVVETVLGLPLRKDMQCSNWEQRPLTSRQNEYAAADAYCLVAIFDAFQVKAFESWFSLSCEDGDEDGVGSTFAWEVTGLQCLVSREFLGGINNSAVGHICHSKRGVASMMANIAIGESGCNHVRSNSSESHMSEATRASGTRAVSIDTLVRRFGEKLLVSEARLSLSKHVRKKGKSRDVQKSSKGQQNVKDKEGFPYVGPPPWDQALGGNGIPKFLCDDMVEGLARQLRCVGIDAASLNSKSCEPQEMVDMAEKEGRIILTSNVQLLRRRIIPANLAHRVTKQGKWDQLAEVIKAFKLVISENQLLSRCAKCNGNFIRRALSAEEALARRQPSQVIPECALQNVDEFWQCSLCKHLYWQGTIFTRAFEQFVTVCRQDSSQQSM